jgi:hypothetical protein
MKKKCENCGQYKMEPAGMKTILVGMATMVVGFLFLVIIIGVFIIPVGAAITLYGCLLKGESCSNCGLATIENDFRN